MSLQLRPGVDGANLGSVRAVIFDVDGVLLDARPSYHAVAEEAARRAVALALGVEAAQAAPFDRESEVPRFKAAGGFNDDWEMSCAIALVLLLRARLGAQAPSLAQLIAESQGQGLEGLVRARAAQAVDGLTPEARAHLSPRHIARICGALYGGRSHCRELFGFDAEDALPGAPEDGLWRKERPLVPPALLALIPARFPVALFTGRNPGEARLALELLQLEVPEASRWVADGRPRKPDPAGLVFLCTALLAEGGLALFLGDTADDARAAAAAQDAGAPLIYAHVQPPDPASDAATAVPPAPGDTARVLTQLLAATEPT